MQAPDIIVQGHALGDELAPAMEEALNRPLPADWDEIGRAAYVFQVVGSIRNGIRIESENRMAEGMSAEEAELYISAAVDRIVRRMHAAGLVLPFKGSTT